MTGASDILRVQAILSGPADVGGVTGVDEGVDGWFAVNWAWELADLDAEHAIETAIKTIGVTCVSALMNRDFIVAIIATETTLTSRERYSLNRRHHHPIAPAGFC